MHRALAEFIARPTDRPCLLIVHPEVAPLRQAVCGIAAENDWPFFSIGEELSAALVGESPVDRPRIAQRWLPKRTKTLAPGPAVLLDVDILFEPSLRLDPLALIIATGRVTRLVVAWPGSHDGDMLCYAAPEHTAYRSWISPAVMVAPLA